MRAMTEARLEILGIEERLEALGRNAAKNRAAIAKLEQRRRLLTECIGSRTDAVLGGCRR